VGRTVSIHSFRGGTGKSNTTANLAALLAGHGRRVAIVDTDIQSPGIHVLFGVDPAGHHATLNDYLWGRCRVEDTAVDVTPEAVRAKGGEIRLVPSSLRAGEIARVLREGYDVERMNDGLLELRGRLDLDFLLIDTHPGLNEETLLSIALSDALLVMLRPDRQDFQGTAVTVDVARKLDVRELFLVVNKVLTRLDRAVLRAKVEGAFGAPVAAIFPESEELLGLGSEGLFCLLHPDHEYSEEMARLAALLLGER
jgi:MinD-like ATPase involved in chromosome partitioning or flagellar assembly